MKLFIPMTDALIDEHPELLGCPCIPYPPPAAERRQEAPSSAERIDRCEREKA